jgi:hypothetical protein
MNPLLPCPHCGRPPSGPRLVDIDDHEFIRIWCCSEITRENDGPDALARIVKLWNSRVP